MDALLNSSIRTINHLDLSSNTSWFIIRNYYMKRKYIKDREGAVEMLTEVISNQTSSLQILNLNKNPFNDISTAKLLTTIKECGVCSTLKELSLQGANWN